MSAAAERGVPPSAEESRPLPAYLRSAAERVTEALVRETATLPEPLHLDRDVRRVACMIENARAAASSTPLRSFQPSPLRVRLLEMLRIEILRDWPEQGDPPDRPRLLNVMRAIERVRQALSADGTYRLGSPVLDPWTRRLLREVAHTVRSPLGSMMFLTEILATGQSGAVNELQRHQLRLLHRATLTVGTLAGNLLCLSGPADELSLSPVPVDLGDLFSDVAATLRPIMEMKGLTLAIDADGIGRRAVPSLALQRTLMNLALPLVDLPYSRGLTLRVRGGGEKLAFSVLADGEAPPEMVELSHVFPPDPEGDGTSLSSAGLAVATAARLLGALGSSLTVVDAGGAFGFRFQLSLPRVQPSAP